MNCDKCGCRLVPVDSRRHGKFYECIRRLNTPDRCSGATGIRTESPKAQAVSQEVE